MATIEVKSNAIMLLFITMLLFINLVSFRFGATAREHYYASVGASAFAALLPAAGAGGSIRIGAKLSSMVIML
jgi:hypothetical protein